MLAIILFQFFLSLFFLAAVAALLISFPVKKKI